MDQLCRLLLAADSYSVVLLRNYCLAGLAQAFHSLERHTAREQAIFEAFVDAVAPKVCTLHLFFSQLSMVERLTSRKSCLSLICTASADVQRLFVYQHV